MKLPQCSNGFCTTTTSSSSLLAAQRGRSNKPVRRDMRGMKKRMKQLKVEMEEIGKEQESIKKGQEEVRGKLEAVAAQCRQLRQETDLLMQQSARTNMRLQLMLQIIRARDSRDLDTAAQLTLLLRGLVTDGKTS